MKYYDSKVEYTTTADSGTEYLRLNFKPVKVVLNGSEIVRRDNSDGNTYILRRLGKGDYAVTIKHSKSCKVEISG